MTYFFFQAEDGIRDRNVTGVQTCALPIFIETIENRDNDKVFIQAAIITERQTQKGILIGKQGSMLKNIGKKAREDIEALLGTKVYLELWVKVQKDWRN